jgi:hypothetical protein
MLLRISILLLAVWVCLQEYTLHLLTLTLDTQNEVILSLVKDNMKIHITLYKYGLTGKEPHNEEPEPSHNTIHFYKTPQVEGGGIPLSKTEIE